jgi:hypothetical protein
MCRWNELAHAHEPISFVSFGNRSVHEFARQTSAPTCEREMDVNSFLPQPSDSSDHNPLVFVQVGV